MGALRIQRGLRRLVRASARPLRAHGTHVRRQLVHSRHGRGARSTSAHHDPRRYLSAPAARLLVRRRPGTEHHHYYHHNQHQHRYDDAKANKDRRSRRRRKRRAERHAGSLRLASRKQPEATNAHAGAFAHRRLRRQVRPQRSTLARQSTRPVGLGHRQRGQHQTGARR